jgi:hypothetical protein
MFLIRKREATEPPIKRMETTGFEPGHQRAGDQPGCQFFSFASFSVFLEILR